MSSAKQPVGRIERVRPLGRQRKRTQRLRTLAVPIGSPPSPPPAVCDESILPPSSALPVPDAPFVRCTRCTKIFDYSRRAICPGCRERYVYPNHRERELQHLFPPDSKIRTVALQIAALQLGGLTDEEIAAQLKLTLGSIRTYRYRAGRNGWLDLDKPQDKIEYELAAKAVRNLEEMLDHDVVLERGQKSLKAEATLRTLEGLTFKQMVGEVTTTPLSMNALSVKVEMMPQGTAQTLREGSIGGVPAYADHPGTETDE